MSEPVSFQAVARGQVQLLQGLTSHLARKVLTGTPADLEALFSCQERLEHWLQYLSPVGQADLLGGYDEAPPPMFARQAPPLGTESVAEMLASAVDGQASDEGVRPRVQFPPSPLWAEDLERERQEEG